MEASRARERGKRKRSEREKRVRKTERETSEREDIERGEKTGASWKPRARATVVEPCPPPVM